MYVLYDTLSGPRAGLFLLPIVSTPASIFSGSCIGYWVANRYGIANHRFPRMGLFLAGGAIGFFGQLAVHSGMIQGVDIFDYVPTVYLLGVAIATVVALGMELVISVAEWRERTVGVT
jgi:uncharacterized membrane protein